MHEPTHIKIYNGEPIPASRPKVTRYGTYYGKRYREFREKFGLWVKQNYKNELEGNISINIYFYMPIPKSLSRKKQEALDGTWHTKTTGDIDNLVKSVLDGLNSKAFLDDSQVCQLFTTKKYSHSPRIEISIKEL